MLTGMALGTGVKMMIQLTGLAIGSGMITDHLEKKEEANNQPHTISGLIKLGTTTTIGFVVIGSLVKLLQFVAVTFL
jgi:hypothetical protein